MALYTLVKPDGTTDQSHDFGVDQPPILAPNKGRWLPDKPPSFDPDTQKLKVVEPITTAALEIPYQIRPLTASQIAKRAAAKDAADDAENMRVTPFAKTFAAMSPKALDDYIDANITDIASTRLYLKRLSRLVLPLIKRELA